MCVRSRTSTWPTFRRRATTICVRSSPIARKNRNNRSGASANDKTRASSGAAGETGARSTSGAIKQLFREAVKVLTGRAEDEPQPQARRRRSGETDKAFGIAAVDLVRRVARLPVEAYVTATGYLRDVLDWMNPYGHEDSADNSELDDALDTKQNLFAPHL
jgi:hypothetical protein